MGFTALDSRCASGDALGLIKAIEITSSLLKKCVFHGIRHFSTKGNTCDWCYLTAGRAGMSG